MANIPNPPMVAGLAVLAPSYRALLCDVWGVVHNGVAAFKPATDALQAYRADGGTVALLTNAPRPKGPVLEQLARLGVPSDAFDDVVTSGEAARALLAERPGVRVLHVGPDRDMPLYDGLPVTVAGEADAELVSCTGLYDDTAETPDDYDASLARWRARDLPMLCSNPDIVVDRGGRLIWCAGALAERYRAVGGKTIVVGKPFPEIYRTALARLGSSGPVLAIGDGIDTDVRGAVGAGIDVAFVTGGIHADLFGDRDRPDVAAVHSFLAKSGLGAVAVMPRLVWRRERP